MANALEKSLCDKNLRITWRHEKSRLLRSAYGVDRVSGPRYEERLGYEFYSLRERVAGSFKPSGLLAIAKPKPTGGNRIICVPTIADRMLQFAVLAELRPKLGNSGLLNSVSYGLMRNANRGVKDARLRAVLMRASRPWVYKADIQKFFDNIPRTRMKQAIREIVRQTSLHKPLLAFVDAEITDGFDPDWQKIVSTAGIAPGCGVRQGMPLSPYFAGMLLRDLDKTLEKEKIPVVRYVDDIIAFFKNREECLQFHSSLSSHLAQLGLSVGHPDDKASKTAIYEPNASAEFLGMEIAREPSGVYCLKISDGCIQKIGAKFCHAASLDELLRKRLTLTRVGGHLDSMENGYLQAYEGAHNHDKLVNEVR